MVVGDFSFFSFRLLFYDVQVDGIFEHLGKSLCFLSDHLVVSSLNQLILSLSSLMIDAWLLSAYLVDTIAGSFNQSSDCHFS